MPGESPNFRKRQLVRPIYAPAVLIVAAETMLLPVLPVTAVGYGINLAGAGAILATILIGSLFAELPGARLIARIGERRAITLSGVLFAIASLLPASGLGLWTLIVAALGIGVSVGLMGLARHSLMAGHVPTQQRARALATLGGMFRTGWTIGPLLGSLVISLVGISATYVVAALLALTSAALLASYPAERLSVERTPSSEGVIRVARANKQVLLTIGFAAGLIQAARVTRLVGLPLLAVHLGLDPALSALLIGITGLIDVLLFPLAGYVMDKYGRFWGSVPTLLLLGVIYPFTPLISDALGFAILALLSALANSMSAGINMVLGADLAPKQSRAEFLAGYRLVTGVGTTIAPVALSAITAFAGIPIALALVSLSNWLGAWLFARYLPRFGLSKPGIDR